MRKIILTTVAVCAAMLFAAKAPAQQPASPPAYGAPINLAQAQAAAAAADAEAKKNGWNMVIAVVGPYGNLIYLQKADLAPNGSIVIAQEKARTSALFRAPSKVFMDRLAGGETYLLGLTGAMPVAGGMPIVVDGKVIGAIGVSGGTAAQDHQVAQAGPGAVK
jgi:glc operon protein GlcG